MILISLIKINLIFSLILYFNLKKQKLNNLWNIFFLKYLKIFVMKFISKNSADIVKAKYVLFQYFVSLVFLHFYLLTLTIS